MGSACLTAWLDLSVLFCQGPCRTLALSADHQCCGFSTEGPCRLGLVNLGPTRGAFSPGSLYVGLRGMSGLVINPGKKISSPPFKARALCCRCCSPLIEAAVSVPLRASPEEGSCRKRDLPDPAQPWQPTQTAAVVRPCWASVGTPSLFSEGSARAGALLACGFTVTTEHHPGIQNNFFPLSEPRRHLCRCRNQRSLGKQSELQLV